MCCYMPGPLSVAAEVVLSVNEDKANILPGRTRVDGAKSQPKSDGGRSCSMLHMVDQVCKTNSVME